MSLGSHDDMSEASDTTTTDVQVESLVAGKERRSTAGNRLNRLLADEAEDDELKLLFAETGEEEDVEFGPEVQEGRDTASDVDTLSSTDEDEGPTAGADDLDGERELENEAREERRKKRKAQETFKRPRPSKVKTLSHHQAGEPAAPAARPKKKSERLSWLPTPEEGPVRQSSRRQTVHNKQVVHERMRENEKRRERHANVMVEAQKRKEALKPKAMTQEDRIAEAAKAEARNAKSLNRWEAAEEKRVEEQRAKIAALKSRKLEGPVISWWSGPAKWVDGKLIGTGKGVLEDVGEARGQAEAGSKEVTNVFKLEARPDGQKSYESTLSGSPTNLGQDTSNHHLHPSLGNGADNGWVQTMAPAAPPPTVELSARSLVILDKIDANTSKLPELQDHVLLRKKGQTRPSSKYSRPRFLGPRG